MLVTVYTNEIVNYLSTLDFFTDTEQGKFRRSETVISPLKLGG